VCGKCIPVCFVEVDVSVVVVMMFS
jgi:hypothetical protein